MVHEPDRTPPEYVGGFRLERLLGSGVLGSTYAARAADGRPAAVKVIHPGWGHPKEVGDHIRRTLAGTPPLPGSSARERALQATFLAPFAGGHDEEAGCAWVATDLLLPDGPDGDGYGRRAVAVGTAVALVGAFPAGTALSMLSQLCSLAAELPARGRSLVGLTPSNAFLTAEGVVVVDVHLAHVLRLLHRVGPSEGEPEESTSGAFVWADPAHLPPELRTARSDGRLRTSSDVYAAAAVTLYACTGSALYPGRDLFDAVMQPQRDRDIAQQLLRVWVSERAGDRGYATGRLILSCLRRRGWRRPRAGRLGRLAGRGGVWRRRASACRLGWEEYVQRALDHATRAPSGALVNGRAPLALEAGTTGVVAAATGGRPSASRPSITREEASDNPDDRTTTASPVAPAAIASATTPGIPDGHSEQGLGTERGPSDAGRHVAPHPRPDPHPSTGTRETSTAATESSRPTARDPDLHTGAGAPSAGETLVPLAHTPSAGSGAIRQRTAAMKPPSGETPPTSGVDSDHTVRLLSADLDTAGSRTDRSRRVLPSGGAGRPECLWRLDTRESLLAAPLEHQDALVVVSGTSLHVVSPATGRGHRHPLQGTAEAPPVVFGGLLWFAFREGRLAGVDPRTGEHEVVVPLAGDPGAGSPAVVDDTLWTGTSAGALLGFTPGAHAGTRTITVGEPVVSTPLSDGEVLWVATGRSGLVGVDVRSDVRLRPALPWDAAGCTPVANPGHGVCVGGADGRLRCHRWDRDEPVWVGAGHRSGLTAPPVHHGDVLLTTDHAGTVCALDAADGLGRWHTASDGDGSTAVAVQDGVVHVAVAEHVWRLSLDDGRPLDPWDVGGLQSAAPVAAHGRLYVSLANGVLLAYGTAG
ncbi:PQQ-binding-like beta-propeller repeat protein [Streptomyces sp. NPDC059165]|uniref:outer membrane protein assembly factor BamB family protein n=1 Tax=Streptomyces sp. NPDC059165 TaxID=3346751 RepID=UPI003675240A